MNKENVELLGYTFQSPYWLFTLLLLPLIAFVLFSTEQKRQGDRKFTGTISEQIEMHSNWITTFRKIILIFQLLAFLLLSVAMAKPYYPGDDEAIEEEYRKGIDIMLAMDVSLSMMAMDFEPNRLEAAKKVAKEFVEERLGDRIGLVVYAGEAYTASPGTVDHESLMAQIDSIGNEPIEGGTAIGTGLGTAVGRLRDETLPSKVVILLTDGSNNAGELDPISAAQLAKEKNVRVYTIGVGTNGEAPTPVITPFGVRFEMAPVEIDEKTLRSIANITGGHYFRATDETSLRSVYKEINQMEKRKQFNRQFAPEEPATPRPFLITALTLLLLSWGLRQYFFIYEN
jgi:Ca-activated chloride channel family protein